VASLDASRFRNLGNCETRDTFVELSNQLASRLGYYIMKLRSKPPAKKNHGTNHGSRLTKIDENHRHLITVLDPLVLDKLNEMSLQGLIQKSVRFL